MFQFRYLEKYIVATYQTKAENKQRDVQLKQQRISPVV